MGLLDFQTAMGRLVRAPDGGDPLRSLHLDERELASLAALKESSGYQFTVGVQRSWCVGRSKNAGYLTLSVLTEDVQKRMLDEWTDCGGGTSSFFAAETEAFLDFIAERLPDPSHELTACRLEQATIRASDGAAAFAAPDPALLEQPGFVLRRGRYAGVVRFYGEPDRILNGLVNREGLPPVSAVAEVVMLFGPGLEQFCCSASVRQTDLWERVGSGVGLSAVMREGHRWDDVAMMLRGGVVELSVVE
jgi:hypothetical protein